MQCTLLRQIFWSRVEIVECKKQCPPGMHWKERGPGSGVRSGQEGGWRGLAKRFEAVTIGYKCSWEGKREGGCVAGLAHGRGGRGIPPPILMHPFVPSCT